MPLLADKVTSSFFGANSPRNPLFEFLFVLHCAVSDPGFISSYDPNRRQTSLRLHYNKHFINANTLVRFSPIVTNRGTHIAKSFFISMSAVKIFCTHSNEMPTVSPFFMVDSEGRVHINFGELHLFLFPKTSIPSLLDIKYSPFLKNHKSSST